MTVKEYLRRKDAVQNALFRVYPDGRKTFILSDGQEVIAEIWLKKHQLPVNLKNYEQPNPDKTRSWMRA